MKKKRSCIEELGDVFLDKYLWFMLILLIMNIVICVLGMKKDVMDLYIKKGMINEVL